MLEKAPGGPPELEHLHIRIHHHPARGVMVHEEFVDLALQVILFWNAPGTCLWRRILGGFSRRGNPGGQSAQGKIDGNGGRLLCVDLLFLVHE